MSESIIKDRLQMVLESIDLIESRMKFINAAEDFIKDEDGRTIMDAVCMRFLFIGECFKKIQKLDEDFLNSKLKLDLSPVIRFRDFIAHHYERTDYEIIYDTCEFHLPKLKKSVIEVLGKW